MHNWFALEARNLLQRRTATGKSIQIQVFGQMKVSALDLRFHSSFEIVHYLGVQLLLRTLLVDKYISGIFLTERKSSHGNQTNLHTIVVVKSGSHVCTM